MFRRTWSPLIIALLLQCVSRLIREDSTKPVSFFLLEADTEEAEVFKQKLEGKLRVIFISVAQSILQGH